MPPTQIKTTTNQPTNQTKSRNSAPGCLEPQCALCQHSTARRCALNFDRKYVVGDAMLARCGAVVRVEAVDCATGAAFEGELPGVRLEMAVLDGNAYDSKYLGEADR